VSETVKVVPPELLEALAALAPDEAAKARPSAPAASANGKHEGAAKPSVFRLTASGASAVERARAYLKKIDPAVSGQHGHDQTFRVACVLVQGFDLSVDDSLPLMREYSGRCQPPWSEKEILHKLEEADKQPGERGKLLNRDRQQANGAASSPGTSGTDRPAEPTIDWAERARQYAAALTPERRAELAGHLGLPEATLALVPLGYLPNDGYGSSCWTVPEVDGGGKVVGLVRLYDGGGEVPMSGSARGLGLPDGWEKRGLENPPLLIVRRHVDALALTAAGLAAVAVPCGGGVAEALAAKLQALGDKRLAVALGSYDARQDGTWPGRDYARGLAAELTGRCPWPARWALPPSRYASAAGWVAGFHADPTVADDWSEIGPQITRDLEDKLQEVPAAAGAQPYSFNVIDSQTFATNSYPLEWYVRRLIVRGQPLVLGGPRKSLKTGLLVDLVLSLGSGVPFLGVEEFKVYRRVKVAILSGESGEAVLQETARRIARAKGINLADANVLWGFDLPQLANPEHMAALVEGLKAHQVEVLVVDPAYLCLLAGLDGAKVEAGNLYQMGPLLLGIARACQQAGTTVILAHHTRKNLAAPYEPLELEDLAYSGTQEFARQWLLVNRREKFEPGSGRHRLWLGVGGSAGQSGLWGVDVYEGALQEDFSGRCWEVTVGTAEAIRQRRSDGQAEKRHAKDREEGTTLLNVIDRMMGEPKLVLEAQDGGKGVSFRKAQGLAHLGAVAMERAVAALIEEGQLEEIQVRVTLAKEGKRWAKGLRRVPEAPRQQIIETG
jgi:hypothetical protein